MVYIRCTVGYLHLSLVDLSSASPTVETTAETFASRWQFQSTAGSVDTALSPAADAASAADGGSASQAARIKIIFSVYTV